MTAIATLRRPVWRGPHSPRHGVGLILRGASWKAGWLIVAHGLTGTGDRLMPYPTSGFNSAVTAANGGPLQVPGADANGGLRIIANQPGVQFAYVVGGTTPVVTVSYAVSPQVTVTAANTTTAAAIFAALDAHAAAKKLLSAYYTGTGASAVGTAFTAAPVPFVRVYGVSRCDVDNSADLVNDATLPLGSPEESCGDAGVYGLECPDSAVYPGGPAFILDNQTVTFVDTPLCLPVPCRSVEDGLAFCDLAVGYR